MKNSILTYSSILILSVLVTSCGGGNSANTPEATPPVAPVTDLSFMVDGIIAENLDHADHATWDLNNFEVNDDIDGNTEAESKINTMIDSMVTAAEANP
ncbi:MAG: hypothetical protein ACC653_13405 [Gammaproteobacteria bacterium]